MEQNIYLIGYMGTGKSTIGRALAKHLDAPLTDMDTTIEKEAGKTINAIFKEHGEEYFRDLETNLLHRLSKEKGQIISCGGGAPLRPENAKLMQDSGLVLWLSATPDTIYNRIKNSKTRPLLANNMTIAHITDMLSRRSGAYEHAATHTVTVDNCTKEEIVKTILEIICH